MVEISKILCVIGNSLILDNIISFKGVSKGRESRKVKFFQRLNLSFKSVKIPKTIISLFLRQEFMYKVSSGAFWPFGLVRSLLEVNTGLLNRLS